MSPPSFTEVLSSIRRPSLRRITSKLSIRTRKSSTGSVKSSFSYHPYAVYHNPTTMLPSVLRDPDTARKLFEAILESPNGRKSLSRLARTCKALNEPALNCLWRELDSILPLLALFPGHLFKKAKKPGMGFAKVPTANDWNKLLSYGERVRRITYEESSYNVATSIFTILQDTRPQTYILPNLLQLVWRTETPAGLDRCAMFVNPELQSLTVEVGTRYPNLEAFLTDVSSRTSLTAFSFTSHTQLPDAFVNLLSRHTALERLMLSAPGALSPEIGKWVASLEHLKSLQLDFFSRTRTAVEGFWDEIVATPSGASTPHSEHSIDSGVFSASDLNERVKVDKSWAPTQHAFSTLKQLHLTGNASNVSAWLGHLHCPLTELTLVIDDPPETRDWETLCRDLCNRFADHLQGLRISATGSSRFSELVRSTSRGAEIELRRLSLERFTTLPKLLRLELDLPESSAFLREDILAIARACPRVETLKLCPTARFNASGPRITLEDLAPLMIHCRFLNTLHVVVNAKKATHTHILFSRQVSSNSLQWLHVGHSWISDPLQVAILLSHLAPRLEQVKFYEKNRAVEANARGWKEASDFLPHLQAVRWMEKLAFMQNIPLPSAKSDKAVDATPQIVSRGTDATVKTAECSVEAFPELLSVLVDATPETHEMEISAIPVYAEQSIEAIPEPEPIPEPVPESPRPSVSELVDTSVFYRRSSILTYPLASILPIVLHLLTFMRKMFISYPLYVPLQMIDFIMTKVQGGVRKPKRAAPHTPSSASDEDQTLDLDSITMETVNIEH